jgi:hypothetical protein
LSLRKAAVRQTCAMIGRPPSLCSTFAARDFVRTGLVLTLIAFALVMLLGATYWHWLGYV